MLSLLMRTIPQKHFLMITINLMLLQMATCSLVKYMLPMTSYIPVRTIRTIEKLGSFLNVTLFRMFGTWKRCCIQNGYSVQNYGKLYQLTVYSYFAYWNTLSKVTSIKYGDNGQIEQTHVYDYNKTNHLVSTDTWYNNKDEIKYKTTYQYPCDIDDGLGGMMSARHYLSPVLSQQSLKDGKLLSTRQLAYTYKKRTIA